MNNYGITFYCIPKLTKIHNLDMNLHNGKGRDIKLSQHFNNCHMKNCHMKNNNKKNMMKNNKHQRRNRYIQQPGLTNCNQRSR